MALTFSAPPWYNMPIALVEKDPENLFYVPMLLLRGYISLLGLL